MEPPHPPPSDRLQLEIALIGAAAQPAPVVEQDESSGEQRHRDA